MNGAPDPSTSREKVSPRPTPAAHQQHSQQCWCLGDSAECCRPTCTCHDEIAPLIVRLRDEVMAWRRERDDWPIEPCTEAETAAAVAEHDLLMLVGAAFARVAFDLQQMSGLPLFPNEVRALKAWTAWRSAQ